MFDLHPIRHKEIALLLHHHIAMNNYLFDRLHIIYMYHLDLQPNFLKQILLVYLNFVLLLFLHHHMNHLLQSSLNRVFLLLQEQ